ncbi:hypothetical protein Tsubulata_010354, partial [Turnera subulata]
MASYISAPLSRSSPPPPPQQPQQVLLSPPKQLEAVTKSTTCVEKTQLQNFRVTTRCADPVPPRAVHKTILERIFNGTSPYHNFPPAHVSKLLRNKKVKGWGSYGAVFERLIRKVKPRVIVEVGTFLGASSLHMADLTRQLGIDSVILCLDDFRGWPGFQDRFRYVGSVNGDVLLLYQFMQNVISHNATGSVLPVPFSSASALEKLCEWGVLGDLIEVDAGHDFNSAWADISRAYRILRPGGVIFGHDYFTAKDNRGVRRAVNLFAQMNGLKVQADGQHWPNHQHNNNKKKTFFRVMVRFLNSPLAYATFQHQFPAAHQNQPEPQVLLSPEPNEAVMKPATRVETQTQHFRVPTRCADPVPSRVVHKTILQRIFDGTSPYHNFPPAHVSTLLRNRKVEGWGSYGAVFEHLIRRVKPKVIIEVGTFLGASALHMADLTRQLGIETVILCIDDFRGWPGFQERFRYLSTLNGDVMLLYQFMNNVIYHNATGSVLPLPFSTTAALWKLCEWGVFGDLIEIDAGHDFNSAWADINRAYRILRPGGVIFGHDYFTAKYDGGVKKAVDLFAWKNGFK